MFAAFRNACGEEFRRRLSDFKDFKSVSSVYFGGGTASMLPAEVIFSLLEIFRTYIPFSSDCEITLEGNPEHLNPGYLSEIFDSGVNRVNAGIQSFNADILNQLKRYHDPDRYNKILEDLSSSPISNFGIDLLYGIGGEDDFYSDVESALRFPVKHLSVYSLTVEKGTPYYRAVQGGKISAPDEDLQFRIFRDLPGFLFQKGFTHYEISNYAREGFMCRHNLGYWRYSPYMGLGPSANGFDGVMRYANPRNIEAWQNSPYSAIKDRAEVLSEIPLSLLRLSIPVSSGVFLDLFRLYFDERRSLSLFQAVTDMFEKWKQKGFMRIIKARDGSISDDIFQWNVDGLLYLDDRIAELSSALDDVACALKMKNR